MPGLDGLEFVSTGLCPNCTECANGYGMELQEFNDKHESGQIEDEPYFSWHSCLVCNPHLGGDRYTAHGVDSNDDIVHFTVCTDCLIAINGLEIE